MLESLSSEELQFIKAIEKYKADNTKNFLSWTEVLKIFKDLGYQKVAKRTDIVVGPTKSKSKARAQKAQKAAAQRAAAEKSSTTEATTTPAPERTVETSTSR